MSRATALALAIGAIGGRMWEGTTSARQMRAEVNRLKMGADALNKVNANRSPLDTPEAHVKKVAALARKFDREVTAAINRSGATMRDGLNDVDRRLEEKISLKPDAFAAEIRNVFRSLDLKGKHDMMARLVAENRGAELAAIVKAPTSLTGISEADRARYEKNIIATHAPAELEEQAKLNESFESLMAATNAAADLVRSLTDPGELARIENGEAAAAAAGEAFNQSLQ